MKKEYHLNQRRKKPFGLILLSLFETGISL
jgi:hypothetical protein